MKKLLISIMILLSGLAVQALPNDISSAVSESGINKDAVSISVKNTTTGKELYKLNSNKPIPPASTQKIITATVSTDTLSEDFEFVTSLYKTTNNELLLKLSGDPYLRKGDLSTLMKAAKNKNIFEAKAFYIDDFVMDSVEWGEGWQWDDDLNPLMPKFSPYNLDGNLLTAVLDPLAKGAPSKINLTTFYPVTFMNLTTTGDENNVTFSRSNNISPDIITVEGTVNKRIHVRFPVNSPRRYFLIKLEEAISSAKLEYYGRFDQRKTPDTYNSK